MASHGCFNEYDACLMNKCIKMNWKATKVGTIPTTYTMHDASGLIFTVLKVQINVPVCGFFLYLKKGVPIVALWCCCRCLHSMSLVVAVVSLSLAHVAVVRCSWLRWLSSLYGGSSMPCGGSLSQCCAGSSTRDASVLEREREKDREGTKERRVN